MRLDLAFMKVMIVFMFDWDLEDNNGTQAQSLAFLCGLLLYVRIFICLRCLWKKCWPASCASRTLFSLSDYHSFNWKTMFCFSSIMSTHMMPVLLSMLCKFFWQWSLSGMIVPCSLYGILWDLITQYLTHFISLYTALDILCQQIP